jgi:NADH-quinone oxidoreductase subunit M
MDELGGLLRKMPFIGTAMIMALLAGCGLPGFANFPGEISVMFGAWKSSLGHAPRFVTAAAWGGLVIGAIYMLRAIRSIWHGQSGRPLEDLLVPEANAWRRLPFVLLLVGLLFFGIFPGVLANRIKISAEAIVKMAGGPVELKAAMVAAQPDGRNP